MAPFLFSGFGSNSHNPVGVVLDRIVTWEGANSLGSFGTRLFLDNGTEKLVGEHPTDVARIIREHSTSAPMQAQEA